MIKNINGKTVYVISAPEVKSAKTSTGEGWATTYTSLRKEIWDQFARGAELDGKAQIERERMISDRIAKLDQSIAALRKGELDAAKAIEINNADNATMIEKEKLQASRVSESSRSSIGSGRSSGGGYGSGGAEKPNQAEQSKANAIASAIDYTDPENAAVQFNKAWRDLSTTGEASPERMAVLQAATIKEFKNRLMSKQKDLGNVVDAALQLASATLEDSSAEVFDGLGAGADTGSGSGGSGGGGFSSSSRYRSSTPQAAIDAAKAPTSSAPTAEQAILDLEAKRAALNAMLGSSSGGLSALDSTRRAFDYNVGGIWGMQDRPNLTRNYQLADPDKAQNTVDNLIERYVEALKKDPKMVELEKQKPGSIARKAVGDVQTLFSQGPVTDDQYMRAPAQPSTADTVMTPKQLSPKPDFAGAEPEELPTVYYPFQPTLRASPTKSPERVDAKERSAVPLDPKRAVRDIKTGDLERDWSEQKPEPSSPQGSIKRKNQSDLDALKTMVEMDEATNDPSYARKVRKEKSVATSLAGFNGIDPGEALAEIRRATNDPKLAKKLERDYIALWLSDRKA